MSSFIVAPSHPLVNECISRRLESGRHAIIRFPGLVLILGEKEETPEKTQALELIAALKELENPRHIYFIDGDGMACVNATATIISTMRGDKRTGLSHFNPKFDSDPQSNPGADWNTVTVTCCDARTAFEMVRCEFRRPDSYTVALPGAAAALVDDTPLGNRFFTWAARLGLGIRLFQHEDCHAYGPDRVAKHISAEDQHRRDIAAFEQQAATFGLPIINKGIVRLNGRIDTI